MLAVITYSFLFAPPPFFSLSLCYNYIIKIYAVIILQILKQI